MFDIKEIRELLGQLKLPRNEVLPEGASQHQCNELEGRTGITLPPEFRAWLMIANAPCVGPSGMFGIRPKREHLDIEMVLAFVPGWRDRGWLPIAGDGCGNYYIVATRGDFGPNHPVLFFDMIHDREVPEYVVASDVGPFLKFLFEDDLKMSDRWPFDRSYVVSKDPDIQLVTGVGQPT